MKILLLSRYDIAGSSSRYRSFQYLPYLRSNGFEITEAPLLSNYYIERLYAQQRISISDVGQSVLKRIKLLLNQKQYDLIWLEGEAFPWFPFWLESLLFSSKIPYVVDYDDAIFHRYDQHSSGVIRSILGHKIDHVMHTANVVIAGNEYLAERAEDAGAKNIEIIPTVVDTEQYPALPLPDNAVFTLGWIGSLSTARYLSDHEQVFQNFCHHGKAKLVTVGIRSLQLRNAEYEVIQPWSEEIEIEQMKSFDIGIMPLVDSFWERGKCGHKLIKYMACGRAVVASPVGVNKEIVEHGVNGFLASTTSEWIEVLRKLRDDKSLRKAMGIAGRKKAEEQYSIKTTAPVLASLFEKAIYSKSNGK